MGSPLQDKSKAFALQIIKVCNEIKKNQRETVLTNQLLRSGTSIGANVREAFYAHGRADFIAKLQIALKECSESEYWLELLIESGYCEDHAILAQCVEIKRLLVASINTAKKNMDCAGAGLAPAFLCPYQKSGRYAGFGGVICIFCKICRNRRVEKQMCVDFFMKW